MGEYFDKSLKNFTFDIVSGDAIRHLAMKGMTIKEISENLTYPADIDMIKNTVWKFYLSNGTIRIDKPEDGDLCVTKTTYVSERDRYGHVSYRMIKEVNSTDRFQYIACDFGRRLYNDKDNFMKAVNKMNDSDKDYILGLPWPIETVYHVKNERMERIVKCIQ